MTRFFKSHIEGAPEALRLLRDDIDRALAKGQSKVPIYSRQDVIYKVEIFYPGYFPIYLNNQQQTFNHTLGYLL